MIVTFEEKYLQDLYERGATDDKRYKKCIQYLSAAKDIEALKQINSLNYEVLKGDKQGISSIRVNKKYRVEFTVKETWEKPIITVCNIIDLSNHYK